MADWERFATVWHSDGWMTATWFQGPAKDFVEVSRTGIEAGANILHQLGGWTCDVVETRAISQAKMTIHQRARVDGVECDVVCWGRFYDFFEKRDGRWAIVRRQPIYEKDRLDRVDPTVELDIDRIFWQGFPRGIDILPICRRRRVSRSGVAYPDCAGPRWTSSMPRGPRGWPERRSRGNRSERRE